MKKYIKDYVSDFEKELNINLINKKSDPILVEFIKDSWKSLEIVKNIKIVKFEYNDNESQLNINNFIFKREKKKKKKDRCDYKYVNDDRYGCLTIWVRLTVEEKDHGKPKIHQRILKKYLLIPIQDENGYYYMKGKKYYIIYQLVDKSTYTSSSSVTLKSLMPVAVKRQSTIAESINDSNGVGNEFVLPFYNVFVFKKEIPIILFYLANGVDWALDYLGVNQIIDFVEDLVNADHKKYIYFRVSSKCYIKVRREPFLNYTYIQSIVGGFLHIFTNRTTIENIKDKSFWIKKLSNNNTIEKGNDILVFFGRLMDETTKKNLMVSNHDKYNIYAVLRWMMMNYNELRLKDNLSLDNKRLRCNEYVASLFTLELSKRLNRIITLGEKATMADYVDMFKIGGDTLIQKMHTSGIMRFDDTMNDMDFYTKVKYTTKGPHSLGGKNSNNISTRYRGLHPSMLGNIDILVCGNSDPGTSGVLSPFGKNIDGLYFNNSKEPDDTMFNLKKDIKNILKEDGVEYVTIKCDNKDDYYRILDNLVEYNKNSIKVSCVSKNDLDIIVESVEEGDLTNEESDQYIDRPDVQSAFYEEMYDS